MGELDTVAARLDTARRRVRGARCARPDAAQLEEEVLFTADLLELALRDARARLEGDGTIGSVSRPTRRRLSTELAGLLERYRRLWLARNRPGGLADSVRWLENLRAAYDTGRPDPGWGGLRAGG